MITGLKLNFRRCLFSQANREPRKNFKFKYLFPINSQKQILPMKNIALNIFHISKQRISKLLLLAIMSLLTIRRMTVEFNRLILINNEFGAIDLKQRYYEVLAWFSGETVYGEIHTAVYPPASYTMLWPFLGYESFSLVRWLWAASTIIALVALIYLLLRESRAKGWLESSVIALMVLSMYGAGETFGYGQLTIHVLVLLVASVVWIPRATIPTSILMTLALIKPTLSLPFYWRTLFPRNRYFLILLIGLEYFALAAIATNFQDGNLLSLHSDWLSSGMAGAEWGSSGGGSVTQGTAGSSFATGYGNIHDWLGLMGLNHLNMPVSLAILFVFGYWSYQYRMVDTWLWLGVAAIISRLWTYHLVYDDLLILLPMITLFRITKLKSIDWVRQLISGGIFTIALIAALIPASLRLRPMWNYIFIMGQTFTWLLMLFFLLYLAWWCKKQNVINNKA